MLEYSTFDNLVDSGVLNFSAVVPDRYRAEFVGRMVLHELYSVLLGSYETEVPITYVFELL